MDSTRQAIRKEQWRQGQWGSELKDQIKSYIWNSYFRQDFNFTSLVMALRDLILNVHYPLLFLYPMNPGAVSKDTFKRHKNITPYFIILLKFVIILQLFDHDCLSHLMTCYEQFSVPVNTALCCYFWQLPLSYCIVLNNLLHSSWLIFQC